MSENSFWSGLNIGDVFHGALGALPEILDKPGKPGPVAQGAETVAPAPSGSNSAYSTPLEWAAKNQALLIVAGIGLIILLEVVRRK